MSDKGIAGLLGGLGVIGAAIVKFAAIGGKSAIVKVGATGGGLAAADDVARFGSRAFSGGDEIAGIARPATDLGGLSDETLSRLGLSDELAHPSIGHRAIVDARGALSDALSATDDTAGARGSSEAAQVTSRVDRAKIVSQLEGEPMLDWYSQASPKNETILIAPHSASSYRTMFSKEITDRRFQSLKSDIDQFNQLSHVTTTTDEAALVNHIKQSDRNYVTIVGHNENGRLKFPSGQEISLSRVSKICQSSGKKCIIVSCNSGRYVGHEDAIHGIRRTISYKDASFIANKLERYFASKSGQRVSYHEVGSDIDNIIARSETELQSVAVAEAAVIPVTAASAGGGVGLVVIEWASSEDPSAR